jgi:hypothetical protein
MLLALIGRLVSSTALECWSSITGVHCDKRQKVAEVEGIKEEEHGRDKRCGECKKQSGEKTKK